MFINPVILQDGKLTVAPVGRVLWSVKPLMNGASKNMATVSIVPQTFNFQVPANEVYYLYALTMGFSSTSTPDVEQFGNTTALTAGIDLEIQSAGTPLIAYTLRDNLDIAMIFNAYAVTGGAAGFLNNADLYLGSAQFGAPIILKGGDFVRAVVNSPTSGSGSDMRIYAQLYKEI